MPSESNDTELDVIIVGGGFTGLSAARELDALGVPFVLLDAFTDHVGGRAYSFDANVPEGSPLRFDHGAQYVGDMQEDIMSLIREHLPAGSLVNGANLRLPYPYEVMVLDQKRYCFRGDQSAFGIPGVPPGLGFTELLAMVGLLAEMTLIEWSIDVMKPWEGPATLLALDEIDAWSWLESKWWVSPTVRDLLRISIEALLSVEPQQISPYYLLWYTACNDGFLNEINDDAGGPQQYWLRRGTDELASKMAAPFADRIRQGVRVASIDHTGDGVVVTTESGEVLRAKKVLVATSPATAKRISFTPPLPAAREALMSQPMGKTIKCQVFYKSAWWHDSNGKAYDGYVGGANYPVLWVMDNSPPDAEALGTHVLMTFTVGAQADLLGPEPKHEAVQAFVTKALRDLFLDERALPGSSEFIRLDMHSWLPSDRFVGGGPNTVFSPKALTGEAGRMLDQHEGGKVFFACAENAKRLRPRSTSSRHSLLASENLPKYDDQSILEATSKPPFYSKYSDRRADLGYMSGAIESGRYVAHELADCLGKPNALPAPVAEAGASEPPLPSEHLASDVAAILAALRERIEATSAGEIGAYGSAAQARGRAGVASWLRETLENVLAGHPNAPPPSDRVAMLAYIRDLAVTTAKYAGDDVSAHPPGVQEHAQTILDHVRALDAHLATKFE